MRSAQAVAVAALGVALVAVGAILAVSGASSSGDGGAGGGVVASAVEAEWTATRRGEFAVVAGAAAAVNGVTVALAQETMDVAAHRALYYEAARLPSAALGSDGLPLLSITLEDCAERARFSDVAVALPAGATVHNVTAICLVVDHATWTVDASRGCATATGSALELTDEPLATPAVALRLRSEFDPVVVGFETPATDDQPAQASSSSSSSGPAWAFAIIGVGALVAVAGVWLYRQSKVVRVKKLPVGTAPRDADAVTSVSPWSSAWGTPSNTARGK